jgi:LAO/AO transport system kinase
MTSWRRGVENGPEAVAGLAEELQGAGTNRTPLQDAFHLSEKFPGELVSQLWGQAGRAATVGITGPPGVGKSTLMPCLVSGMREDGSTVGVIAVDPSSTSGGSLMADRLTIMLSAERHGYNIWADRGVWIRSFSAAGSQGGVSEATLPSMLAFDVSGKDIVIVETVGVGQSELDISYLVDTTVVMLQPDSGDSLQAMKSGVMEIPDILCVNQRDPEAGISADLYSELRISGKPLITINAATGEGVDNLLEAINKHREQLGEEGLKERRQQSLEVQLARLSIAYTGFDIRRALKTNAGKRLLEEVGRRENDPFAAARELRGLI